MNYLYNSAGNLFLRTDARNITTQYSYDALNRLLQTAYSDGTPGVTYSYDTPGVANGVGRVAQIANSNSATLFGSYDALGRVLSSGQSILGESYSFSYSYNLAGALVSETYPSGRVLTNTYDGAGRVSQVAGVAGGQTGTAATTYVYNASYWPHGALYFFGEGNNVAPVWTYNSRLQINSYWATVNSDANHYLLYGALWYGTTNDNGNVYNASEGYGTSVPYASLAWLNQSFSYDTVNRLTAASDTGGWSRNFGYDAYGNMWVTAAAAGPWSGSTPIASTVFTGANQIAGTSYDAAGNQLQVNGNGVGYDAENRVTTVTESAASETIQYDGLGQRVEKTLPAVTTVYVYDAFGQLAAEYSDAANTSSPCVTCYLVWDHLGTARMVTDQNGNVVARHDYLPFGEEITGGTVGRAGQWRPGNDNINQKFTGQERI